MLYDNKTKIIISGIKLAGKDNVEFDEYSLSQLAKISLIDLINLLKSDLSNYFYLLDKDKSTCSKCNSRVDIEKELDYCICTNCNKELDLTKCSRYKIGLNIVNIEEYLTSKIKNLFLSKSFEERDSDDNFLVMKNNGIMLAVSVSLECNGLRDYFSLRGWAYDYDPLSYIIISKEFDSYIISYQDKDLKCSLISFDDIFDEIKLNSLLKKIKEKNDLLKKQKKIESNISLQFRKFGDLSKLLDDYSDMIKLLPLRALQQTDESVKRQGDKFEKDIVKILNFTILRTKYLGGGNEPDGLGIIQRFNNSKSKWYPIELKTFTPENVDTPYYPLKKVTVQIVKYVNSFMNEEIKQSVEIPSFIAIAYDFDINNPDEINLIETFESKYNLKLILFPLSSIIKLFKGFHDNNISSIPSDIIEKFIVRNRYITNEQVENLIKDLIKHNKEKYIYELKTVRAKTKEQGV